MTNEPIDDLLKAPGDLEEAETEEEASHSVLEGAGGEAPLDTGWMVPYGNMITILMIFFLALFAFSQGKTASFEKAIQEIRKELTTKIEQVKEKVLQEEQEAEVAEALETYLSEEYAHVDVSAERIHISLASPVLFDSGRADLKGGGKAPLAEISKWLKDLPNEVLVEGHTDSIPIRSGRFNSNFELSASRAFSVIRFFIDEGVSPDRLSAYGYGEFSPVADNATPQGRATNRRIEISILRKGAQAS